MRRIRIAGVLLLALSSASPSPAQQAVASATACDRACLTATADAYFAALAVHDPSRAALAPGVKFTENTQVLAIGDGLWKTASDAPGGFKVYVPDAAAGQIGALVLMKESGKAVEVALRLKVVNRQITEAEHLVARNVNEANFQAPPPALLATVPPNERLPRSLMLVIGHAYYDALEQSDGSVAPFADACIRRENGMQTGGPRKPAPSGAGGRGNATGAAPRAGGPAGPGFDPSLTCAQQIDSRTFYYITSIDLRRVWIADEEKGLVFGLSMFRHPMDEKVFTVIARDGTRVQRDMSKQNPFDFAAAHVFKIQGGRIHDIEAMGFTLPYRSKNGWSDFLR